MSTTYRTNIVTTKDKKLITGMNSSLFESRANINQWNDSAKDLYQWTGAASEFNIQTKDIDFGDPSRRKKIYKVYVTFKAGGFASGVKVKYAVNGSNDFASGNTFQNVLKSGESATNRTIYDNVKGFDSFTGVTSLSTDDWITVGLKPTNSIKNIHSFQLKFEFANVGFHSYNLATIDGSGLEDEFTLHSSASDVDDYYNGMPLYFYKGPGAGHEGYIVEDYTGSTRKVKVGQILDGVGNAVIFATNPISTSTFPDIGFIPKEFAINDISIIYRNKPIK
tara:strand:- start:569 stop:1405 length:837 start_codon:yes stop_codon:yes gene_type:complete